MTRCSQASLDRGEALTATASVVDTFLLLEDPGPWGPAVLHNARLPGRVRELLARLKAQHGVRPLLIRRPGRTAPGPRRIFAVNARHGWVQTALLADLHEVTTIDFSGLGSASGIGLDAHPEPLALVCTHGRHDPCCAERGRPVAATLADRFGAMVWESSHLGGDRFAGNLVLLPRGDYFGRLDPEIAPAILERYLGGELDLAQYRGRSTQRWPVQAAVSAARAELAVPGLDAVEVLGVLQGERFHVVSLLVAGRPVTAHVRVGRSEPVELTCSAAVPESAPSYRVSLQYN